MKVFTKLAYPRLDLPQYQHVAIFRAVEKVLRTDAVFPRACNTFLCWSGTSMDAADPAFGLCPFCRISPLASPAQMATERQHSAPLILGIECATIGTNFDDLGNFWGTIWRAIWSQADLPRFADVSTILHDAGVTRPVMTMQAFMPAADGDENPMMVARGNFTFNSLLPK